MVKQLKEADPNAKGESLVAQNLNPFTNRNSARTCFSRVHKRKNCIFSLNGSLIFQKPYEMPFQHLAFSFAVLFQNINQLKC